jgi:hypothetical protein
MNIIDITDEDWDEIKAIAKHLGRDAFPNANLDGANMAFCPRKKPFDKLFNIAKTTEGFIVFMSMEDINYTPSVIAGNTYVCRFDGLYSYYLVDVIEVTNEYIKVNYHVFKDAELTEELHPKMHNVIWFKDQVIIVSFSKYNP